MAILGAHMSVAGGHHNAITSGAGIGCDCVQIFTKNNNRWAAKPLTEEGIAQFKQAQQEHGISHTLSHASYLINIASPKDELRTKSKNALVDELERAGKLGVPHVVFHPGSFTTGTEDSGIELIVESLLEVLDKTTSAGADILLENTAGQGTNLGWQFEQLGRMINGVENHNARFADRIGVCIDTCHTFAAGYPLAEAGDYTATFKAMDDAFGLDRIKAFHLNDSKKPFGSRRDRHEHIGLGEMGLEPFRNLLNDPRFQEIPMYLETEKDDHDDGRTWDEVNLETLRNLIA
ncbi:MAG: deoxyribonuclease IV [Planctomycetota bacterium]